MSQFTKFLIASTFIAATSAAVAQSGTPGNAMPSPSQGAASSTSPTTMGTTAPGAINTGAPAASTSTDPYIQKRDADAAAKKEYGEKRKAAKAEYKSEKAAAKSGYKTEKAEAKSDLQMEKRESSAERNSAITADPAKPAMPGQTNYSGK